MNCIAITLHNHAMDKNHVSSLSLGHGDQKHALSSHRICQKWRDIWWVRPFHYMCRQLWSIYSPHTVKHCMCSECMPAVDWDGQTTFLHISSIYTLIHSLKANGWAEQKLFFFLSCDGTCNGKRSWCFRWELRDQRNNHLTHNSPMQ